MISKAEKQQRFKMALGSGFAYALVMAVVLWFDRGNLANLASDHIRLVVHGHFFLALVSAVWIMGYERYNPLVAAALLVDILIIAWDRVDWGPIVVVVLGILSCVYATVRNVSTSRNDGGTPHGT